jgi:hypothetical protein
MEAESFGRTREFLGRKWQWVLVQLIAATRGFVSQGFANVGGGAYPERQPRHWYGFKVPIDHV